MWGLSYERPAVHMREYLTILKSLVETGSASFRRVLQGECAGPGACAKASAAPCRGTGARDAEDCGDDDRRDNHVDGRAEDAGDAHRAAADGGSQGSRAWRAAGGLRPAGGGLGDEAEARERADARAIYGTLRTTSGCWKRDDGQRESRLSATRWPLRPASESWRRPALRNSSRASSPWGTTRRHRSPERGRSSRASSARSNPPDVAERLRPPPGTVRGPAYVSIFRYAETVNRGLVAGIR